MGLAVIWQAGPMAEPVSHKCECLETTPGPRGSLTSSYTLVEDSM